VIRSRWPVGRYAWIAVLIVGYAGLAHYTNSNPDAKPLGAILAIAPPFALGIGLAWRSALRLPSLALVAVSAALIIAQWRLIEAHFSIVYLIEELSVYGLLSVTFARTLVPGAVPLCTHWADLVHGPLPAFVARYTRNTTAAWAAFFALMTLSSLALYIYAPLAVWSAFSNFATLPLVGLMFVGEYLVRRRVLPPLHRTSLLASVQVYLDASRRATSARP
jgi:uncharacterized membrane protein